MAQAHPAKTSLKKVTAAVEARIVEISLQHHDLGAMRLLPLLEKENISVSKTTVYAILKNHGIQTREKRLKKLKAQQPESTTISKKKPTRVPPDLERRAVEISLQHPDYGARRLVPILKKENISIPVSALYTILRRHGLQTREKRLAKFNQKAEVAPVSKKKSAKTPPEVEQLIVDLSLQNPDYGARRLESLLKKDKIFVSESTVYSILRRHNLHTRDRRLAQKKNKTAKAESAPSKFPAEIWPEVEERIIEISLQNPDYGARRLVPLLKKEAIEVAESRVYRTLKRYGLQTCDKRLLKCEALGAIATPPSDKPDQAAEDTTKIPPPARQVPAPLAPKKSNLRTPWIFHIANLLLLALVGYFGYHAYLSYHEATAKPNAIAATKPEPARIEATANTTVPALQSYRKIWEKNIFNTTVEKDPGTKKEIAVEKIAPAKKDLGLKLLGTIVSGNTALSRAIVHVQKTREQEAYREGDNAGQVVIKKILRNKVVITTAEGDKLLTIDPEDYGRQGRAPGSLSSSQQTVGSKSPQRTRSSSIELKQDDVTAAFEDFEKVIEESKISPYMKGGQPSGFRIGKISPQSILRKMGLRSRDVITGVDDTAIESPEQAAEVFKKISEGGEVTVTINRRRRTRKIKLNIE